MNASLSSIRSLSRAGSAFALLSALSAVAGCATTPPNLEDARRLAEVSAIAGAPVTSFRYLSMSSFEPIGDSNLLIFTSPRSAWLLRVDGPCRDLDFDPFLGITSNFGRVSSGFDKVIVRDNPIACRIEQIRPVDAGTLRHIDRERKAQDQPVSKPVESPARSSNQSEPGGGGT